MGVFWIYAIAILLFIGLLMGLNRNPGHVGAIVALGIAWLAGYLALGYFVGRWMSRGVVPSSALGWVGAILVAPFAFVVIGFGTCTGSNALFGPV